MRRLVAVLAALVLALAITVQTAGNVGIDTGTNAVRAKAGLAPLQTSSLLASLANQRVHEIVTDFNHHLPQLESQLPSCWRGLGENIAWVSTAAGSSWAVSAWANSPEHYANMVGNFDQQGSALLQVNGNTYAVQIFLLGCVASQPAPKPTAAQKQVTTHKAAPVVLPNTSIAH